MTARLTPHQRRVLQSSAVYVSDSTGRAWAYEANGITEGESFDVRGSTVEKLAARGLIVFVAKVSGVHEYRPDRHQKRADMQRPDITSPAGAESDADRLKSKLEVAAGDLFMLRKAIEAGDPKAELLQRIHDALGAIRE